MSIVSDSNDEPHPALPLVSYDTGHERDLPGHFVNLILLRVFFTINIGEADAKSRSQNPLFPPIMFMLLAKQIPYVSLFRPRLRLPLTLTDCSQ